MFVLWLAALLCLLACDDAADPTEEVPRFEETACRFDLPEHLVEGENFRCGDLHVREVRGDPASSIIRVHVGIVPGDSGTSERATFFLMGGPGTHIEYSIADITDPLVLPLLTKHGDYVVFDQRGAGRSIPNLECDDDGNFMDSLDGLAKIRTDALRACFADYRARGIDVAGYSTEAAAADVEELRVALGYSKINLVGISYGTHLALEVMRRYGAGINAVVLDSVDPPNHCWPIETGQGFAWAIERHAAACAADAACDAAYPELEQTLAEAVASLDQTPLPLPRGAVEVSGAHLLRIMSEEFFSESWAFGYVPALIYAAHDRDAAGLTSIIETVFPDFFAETLHAAHSEGAYEAYHCNDHLQYFTAAAIDEQLALVEPVYRDFFEREFITGPVAICESDIFNRKPQNTIDRDPVVSDIPTLVLVGALDYQSPPYWGRQAAETLSNHYLFELANSGHVQLMTLCGINAVAEFLDDPWTEPNRSLINMLGISYYYR